MHVEQAATDAIIFAPQAALTAAREAQPFALLVGSGGTEQAILDLAHKYHREFCKVGCNNCNNNRCCWVERVNSTVVLQGNLFCVAVVAGMGSGVWGAGWKSTARVVAVPAWLVNQLTPCSCGLAS